MLRLRRRNIDKLRENWNVDAVNKTVGDKDPTVRSDAAQALGDLGDLRAAYPLAGLLNDEDRDVREAASEALRRLGTDTGLVDELVDALAHPDGHGCGTGELETLALAAGALGVLGDVRAVRPLAATFTAAASDTLHPVLSSRAAQACALALVDIGDDEGLEALVLTVQGFDRESSLRRFVASVLEQRGHSEAAGRVRSLGAADRERTKREAQARIDRVAEAGRAAEREAASAAERAEAKATERAEAYGHLRREVSAVIDSGAPEDVKVARVRELIGATYRALGDPVFSAGDTINLCGCGFPVTVGHEDGSTGPLYGLTRAESPDDLTTREHHCPRCGRLAITIEL